MSHTTSTVTMPDENGYQKCVTTDLAKQLRDNANFRSDLHVDISNLLHEAAAEIERYYGGMLAWKRVAETQQVMPDNELLETLELARKCVVLGYTEHNNYYAIEKIDAELAKRKPNKPVLEL